MDKIYKWEEWFGRDRIVLIRGIHYHCSQSTMCQTIRNNASKKGVSVKLLDAGSEIVIEVRRRSAISHTNTSAVAG